MGAENSNKTEAAEGRRPWEPPALVEMKIGAQTKSGRDPEGATQSKEPPQPAAPTSKLGFYFEWGFPLSSRVTK
jgi:hypothetical protein